MSPLAESHESRFSARAEKRHGFQLSALDLVVGSVACHISVAEGRESRQHVAIPTFLSSLQQETQRVNPQVVVSDPQGLDWSHLLREDIMRNNDPVPPARGPRS